MNAHADRRPSATVPLLAALAVSVLGALGGSARSGDAELKTFERAWQLVDRHFYDEDHHGVDWEAVYERYLPAAREADDSEEARAVIQAMIAELRASHCSVLDEEVYRGMMAELANKRVPTFGLVLEETEEDRYFVRALFEGGPAAEAGIALGDRVVAVDGELAGDSPRLVDAGYDPGLPGAPLSFLRVGDEPSVSLVVQSRRAADSRRVVRVEARSMNGVDALRNSARVVAMGRFKIGVAHLWYCQRGATTALREALEGELAECDALVLDVRGRGGFADVVGEVLGLFGAKRGARGKPSSTIFAKPIVVLIDERSRSAKEILAWRVRKEKLGTLVGRHTEGAVLGATFHPLPDGSWLELAGMEVPVNGVSLEGVGVEPDVLVEFDLRYLDGRDPILERGLEVALEKAKQRRRGPY